MMMRKLYQLLFICACLAACHGAQATQVRYMLWDSLQLPAYRQCAVDFAKQNPGITVRITQSGWDDYWTAITTGFIAEYAPDVFTNHLSRYPAFASNNLLVDLTPYIRRDQFDLSIFPQGLVEVWGRDGKQYGLPKDWDTIGLMVNMAHARKAGVTLAELQDMNWNPKDGGSFEQVLKKLTIDAQGRNALSPDFDKKNIVVHGYQNPGPGGMMGQTQWSHFAVSNGFRFQDKPWAVPYHYDDQRLAETIDWLAGLPDKGMSASYTYTRNSSASAMFAAGKVAMVPDGAWMIGYYASNAKFENAWVPLPKGPSGQRASMLNGLGDSMWIGSKVKDEAWKWMKYLASPDCQNVVAKAGIVFPAINGMADKTLEVYHNKGIDASAFLIMAKEQTFLMPIADNGAQVDALMNGAIESVLLGKQQAGPALKEANAKANDLLNKSSRAAKKHSGP
jgi:multiple sugar transport system substrate-binding protein